MEGNDFYKDLIDNLFDGVYFVDRDKKITYWNKGAERLTGYASTEVMGKNCSYNILMHVDDDGVTLCKEKCPLSVTLDSGQAMESQAYLHHKSGHRLPVMINVAPIRGAGGEIVGAVEIFSDNSSRMKIEELENMAFLDPVTAVGNRRHTEMTIRARLEELRRYGWPFGVLFFDLDNFKTINDAYGHNTGDAVLKMAAQTVLNSLRPFDFLGRWGGEEFVAIIINVSEEHLVAIAQRFRRLVEQSGIYAGKSILKVTVSIGATLARPGEGIETLIGRADSLMYKGKTAGKNCVIFG